MKLNKKELLYLLRMIGTDKYYLEKEKNTEYNELIKKDLKIVKKLYKKINNEFEILNKEN